MKRVMFAIAFALSAAPAISFAGDEGKIHGVINFVGIIERGPCSLLTSDWFVHSGRTNGISPLHAGVIPAPGNMCAGIADTSSIHAFDVVSADTSVKGKVVVVTFN
ncbi:hypothetical protein [Pseudomonas sp. OTU5201]|uniref:hypothetical protein n=1 Tax=Pseudomonas sp. OTU5201 TaxID=3043850 RepID=UPI00313EB7E7